MSWLPTISAALKAAESAKNNIEAAALIAKQKATELSQSVEHVCSSCQKTSIHLQATIELGLTKYEHCRICRQLFCMDCLKMTTIPIPHDMWSLENTQKQPSSGKGLACEMCRDTILKRAINEFVSFAADDFNENVTVFLDESIVDKREYPCPGFTKDTNSRLALRAAKLADIIIDFTPLGKVATTAIRFAFYGSQILSYVVPEDIYVILVPLMEGLQAFEVKGPSGVLKLYYLGCFHERERKMNPELEFAHRKPGDEGIVDSPCGEDLLDLCGRYAGVAQWMYNCQLPSPNTGNDWSCWYLSRLIRIDSWVLLASLNETTKLPNGKNCPSFCLAARYTPNREVVLNIRGSKSAGCWAINAKYQSSDFTYSRHGGPVVAGKVHKGMLDAATSILDQYEIFRHLYNLAKVGFKIRVVGHSMGGGTAAIIAAEIINRFSSNLDALGNLPDVQAITYGSPPCVTSDLASAFADDSLVITVVNQDDFIPRLGRHTLLALAKQLKEVEKVSAEWKEQDAASLKAYAASIGQAGLMGELQKPITVLEEDLMEPDQDAKQEDIGDVGGDAMEESDPQVVDDDEDHDVLVVAGIIVNIFKRSGLYSSCIMTHAHPSMRTLHLLVSKGASEHVMDSYTEALRGTKTVMRFKENKTGMRVQEKEVETVNKIDHWSTCYLCGLDVSWMYISRSEATKALVSHRCSNCNRVVCCVCAPAGDKLPDEGISKTQTLVDHRISLPLKGIVEPSRVCLHCIFNSYEL